MNRIFQWCYRTIDWVFGVLVIGVGLAALSAIPVLHFFTLGYFLEASGAVARTGKLRSGFLGVRKASRLGKVIVCVWLILLPIRLAYSYWQDAIILDPQGPAVTQLRVLLVIMITVASCWIAWAVYRGGRFRHFLWPAPLRFIKAIGYHDDELFGWRGWWDLARGIPYWRFFKLGFFGFIGALIWLTIPVLLLFAGAQISSSGPAFLVSLIGGGLLAFVALYLPFLQCRFAVGGDFREFLTLRRVREHFQKAPLAWWVALFITLLFAVPLYALKIELTPSEVAWLPNLIFVAFGFPARLLVGWASSRAARREGRSHWFWRWSSRLSLIPIVIAYAFIIFLTQYLSWHGSYSLFEQHAFLLPAPMFGL
ncbi:MAG: DUF4013 domain-containing protein [Verrucomicrobiota bacterium]